MIPSQTPEAEARRRTLIVVAVVLVAIPVVLVGVRELVPIIRGLLIPGSLRPVMVSSAMPAAPDPTVTTEVWRVGTDLEIQVKVDNATSTTLENVEIDKVDFEGLVPSGVPKKIGTLKPHSSTKVTFVIHKPFAGKSEGFTSIGVKHEEKSAYGGSTSAQSSGSILPIHEAAKPGLKRV
ncbi:hypothetical protein [Fimbriimonas ginsengisoli]|uniref:Uncharacterized protein n=1 Tax=Fimbriimonas ginsengisoli Gsoil 348 TaxID=661478 RepID=A0A068NWU2_FIMGI|nr:hypothetical protein [Fimbriimonas ginsengisoli]AIE87842.1 hypothetical protein OP10G_4474 [Fimbriimonas ginsengisoli Gsoil 348]